ncbi:MAG: 50S ribosomal protein L35 [Comamonadaceae bacterium]|nr:50S ribosomal protein L35 [Comamonadaceae bacterium]
MPKMKTKSGAKKRFRVRPGGTVKRGQAFKRHILTKKTHQDASATCAAPPNVHETDVGTSPDAAHAGLIRRKENDTCLASNVV